MYSEIVWLRAGWTAPTRANANRTTGLPNSYPHATSNKKTWFGYWREDGFVKIKNLGRVDRYYKWPAIRDRWIESFRNREVHAGESVMASVTAEDEWVAEAYMETNYSTLSQADFEKVLLDYALFTLGYTNDDGDVE